MGSIKSAARKGRYKRIGNVAQRSGNPVGRTIPF